MKPLVRAAILCALLLASASCGSSDSRDDEALIAVASNFASTAARLEQMFEEQTSHRVTLSTASTGALFAQIEQGAPFDILLAADQERPRRLVETGWVEPEDRTTYAVGRLVLWSPDPEGIGGSFSLPDVFRFSRIAIANPEVAPYGLAAREALVRSGLWEALEERVVRGESVAQTLSLVVTGNSSVGFIAQAQLGAEEVAGGSHWAVPPNLHGSLSQDAVLLKRSKHKASADAFFRFLQSEEARREIEMSGYGLVASST